MLHQNALLAARNHELEEQLAVLTKRKMRKRKWIQQVGTIEYGEAATQVAAEASVSAERSKKARGGSDQETASVRHGGSSLASFLTPSFLGLHGAPPELTELLSFYPTLTLIV
jgi:hypothetical protein